MNLLDQSGVTGGGLDPYNALFVNMDNMWMKGFGNYHCLVELFLSTDWVNYEEEPMKYQALRPQFFSVGGVGGLWQLVG